MSQTQTRRSSQVDLLHGSILKSLLLFALPIMASRVFQQIYNTMDTLIVGYTLGDSFDSVFVFFAGGDGCLLVDL